jgi:hypothetical protein
MWATEMQHPEDWGSRSFLISDSLPRRTPESINVLTGVGVIQVPERGEITRFGRNAADIRFSLEQIFTGQL